MIEKKNQHVLLMLNKYYIEKKSTNMYKNVFNTVKM